MNKITLTFLLTVITSTVFSQLVAPPQKEDYEKVFTLVEREAIFPGGLPGWKSYLEKNLKADLANRYIKLPKKQKLAQQTVFVQFIVDKEGKISKVNVINPNEVHPMLAQEAVRVIKQGPDWIPAEQNKKKVTYQAIQKITFQVERD